MNKITSLFAFAVVGLGIQTASAGLNYWVNWTGAPGSYPNTMTTPNGSEPYATSASGTLYEPTLGQTINVTYSGEVYGTKSEFNGSGANEDIFNYPSTYLGSTVTTLPPSGNYISLTGYSGLTNTLTFSSPVTNLVMAISSLGSAVTPGSFNFNRTAVIASSGGGKWGNGPLTMSSPTTASGSEGNGIIQFTGTFSSLSWTVPQSELSVEFNIGVSDTAAPGTAAVPEPGQVAASLLLLGGIGGYVFLKRRKSAQAAMVPAAS